MADAHTRFDLVFRPRGDFREFPFLTRVKMARRGIYALTPVTEQSQPDLFNLVHGVSAQANIEAPKIYIWHSTKPGANASSIMGKQPIMAFSDTLPGLLTPEELTAVTAHELGHLQNAGRAAVSDILAMIGGAAVATVATYPMRMLGQHQKRNLPPDASSPLSGKILALGRFALIMVGARMGVAFASRNEEHSADRFATSITGSGTALMSALQKMQAYSAMFVQPKQTLLKPYRRLTQSHPSARARSEALGVTSEDIRNYQAMQGGAPLLANTELMPAKPEPAMEPSRPDFLPGDAKWQRRLAETTGQVTTFRGMR